MYYQKNASQTPISCKFNDLIMGAKKIFFYTFFLYCSSCGDYFSSSEPLNKKYHYILPESYSGVVFIEFGKINAPPLIFRDTALIITVPDSGIVETSTVYNDFAKYSNRSNIKWKNDTITRSFEMRNWMYGYFQTKKNLKVDTIINDDGEVRFRRETNASDFNYVCFYVNFDTIKIGWDSLLLDHFVRRMDCKSIVERRTYIDN